MVSPVGTFFIVLAVFIVIAAVGWIVFTQLRARRLGLPPPPILPFTNGGGGSRAAYAAPTPRPGGLRGWISDRMSGTKNKRSAAGAYESSSRTNRGFGPLDPDDAWDTNVGYEAELDDRSGPYGSHAVGGLGIGAGDPTAYTGSGYHMNLAGDGAADGSSSRGRSPMPQSRGGLAAPNPFDDDAAEPSNISLRGVSPRPIDTRKAAVANTAGGGTGQTPPHDDSPTSITGRRSVFRENM